MSPFIFIKNLYSNYQMLQCVQRKEFLITEIGLEIDLIFLINRESPISQILLFIYLSDYISVHLISLIDSSLINALLILIRK